MLQPTSIRHHLAMMQARGFASSVVLANTGIEATRLADPTYLVEPEQCHAVVDNMLRVSADPVLGLDIGSRKLITDLGIVGYAMASATTLGQAIALWVQYGSSLIGVPFTLKLTNDEHSGLWGAIAVSERIGGEVFRFYVEETIAVGFTLGPQLLRTPLVAVQMSFSYPAPPNHERYETVFGCPVASVLDTPP